MKINYATQTIEMTATFEKKAQVYNSEEYCQLVAARRDFPTFKLIRSPKNKKANAFKGMDYDFMRSYIQSHDDSAQNETNLDELIAHNLSYGEIKQWFISIFPVFKDCATRAQWILAK